MLLLAVIDFLHDGEEPDLDGISEGMFMMIRPTLENSRTRSEAGRRGGRPPRQGDAEPEPEANDKQTAKQNDKQTAKQNDKQTAKQNDKQNSKKSESKTPSYQDSYSYSYSRSPSQGEGVQGEGGDGAEEATERVIAHLNATCGTAYRLGSAKSRQLVGARLREGFSAEDCERVIDNMAARWLGDERMRRYLRPETLFNATKFEGYLNAGPPRAAPAEAIAASLASYDEGAVEWVPVEEGDRDVQRA